MRWVFDYLSPAGHRARLSVLIFHRVLPDPDPLFPGEPDAVRFETQMRWLDSWFNLLPLGEAVKRLREGTLPARAAAITFDDGYADNYIVATPILQRLGLTATFFIATGYLDGGCMWNDTVIEAVRRTSASHIDLNSLGLGCHALVTIGERRTAVNRLLGAVKYLEPAQRETLVARIAATAGVHPSTDIMLTSDQVRAMVEAGMSIGAHTVSHPILSRISEAEGEKEMTQSKHRLEAITGRTVNLFAYPNGKPRVDYAAVHADLARRVGFEAAVSTGWGAATGQCDYYQIPRFTPWDRAKWRYAMRLARNLRTAADVVQ